MNLILLNGDVALMFGRQGLIHYDVYSYIHLYLG